MAKSPAASAKSPAASAKSPAVRSSLETYTDLVYGSPEGIGNNNCYAYAIGHYRGSGRNKLQPGEISGSRGVMSLQECGSLRRRVAADLGADAKSLAPGGRCPRGWHEARAFLAPGKDYHWYRRHEDVLVSGASRPTSLARRLGVRRDQVLLPPGGGGLALVRGAKLFSHKRGLATGPLLEDSCGRVIRDPERACRDYGDLNYTKSCGGFCVRDSPRVVRDSPRVVRDSPRVVRGPDSRRA